MIALPKLRSLRLLTGFPIVVIGVSLPLVGISPWFFYFVGCTVASSVLGFSPVA